MRSGNASPKIGRGLLHVRLTPTEEAALDQLCQFHGHPSRSAAVRAALMAFYRSHKLKPEALRAIEQERLFHRPRRGRLATDRQAPETGEYG